MGNIFISYRRKDSQSAAGRLGEGLENVFGNEAIFRDVLKIPPGTDYVEVIETALGSCVALLAVIGPEWLRIQDDAGHRRLDDPDDLTRREIEIALHKGLRVVPVLVEGADMPRAADLPDGLRPLAKLQAHELTDKRWTYDLGTLVAALAKVEGMPEPRMRPAATARARLFVVGTAILAVTAVALLYAVEPLANWLGLDDLLPIELREFIHNHADDGGTLLVILALLVAVAAFLDRQQLTLSDMFADPRRLVRASVVVIGCALGLAFLVRHEMWIGAAMATALGLAYLFARRLAPGAFQTVARTAIWVTVGLAATGGAMAVDLALAKSRESQFDVTFLMPPDGGHSDKAETLLNAVKEAFQVSLADVGRVKIVPDQMTKDDFQRYAYSRKNELLAYDKKYGHPRIFIRSKYNHDEQTKSLTFLVTPYLRDPGGKRMLEMARWQHDPWTRTWNQNEISMAAYQASFDLVSFLSSEKLLTLTAAEQQSFWKNTLTEYGKSLKVAAPDCAVNKELAALLLAGAPLEQSTVQRVLATTCVKAPGDSTAAKTAIDAVAKVYSAMAQ